MLACRDSPPAVSARVPQPTDSLGLVLRAALTDTNPRQAGERILCEEHKLFQRYGIKKAREMIRSVTDTIYTWTDFLAQRRLESRLGGRDYSLDACDVVDPKTGRPLPVRP
jgi:hypothetical protein